MKSASHGVVNELCLQICLPVGRCFQIMAAPRPMLAPSSNLLGDTHTLISMPRVPAGRRACQEATPWVSFSLYASWTLHAFFLSSNVHAAGARVPTIVPSSVALTNLLGRPAQSQDVTIPTRYSKDSAKIIPTHGLEHEESEEALVVAGVHALEHMASTSNTAMASGFRGTTFSFQTPAVY